MIRAPRTVKPAPTMDDTIAKKSRHPMRRVLDVLAGFHLASVLILLLGILTWLGTLEQVDMGLFEVKKKYFSASTFWVVPKYNGYTVPLILPNAYWVGMLFFLNLSLGTIFKARWRPATMGILIAHFGILFLLLGAFVTQHFSKRGNMAITEGETSDVAQDYFDHVIEVTELVDGKPAKVNVVETKYLSDLDPEDTRLFRMENLPFDLKVQEYRVNARPVSTAEKPAQPGSAVVDGYFLDPREPAVDAERNLGACRLAVLDKKGESLGAYLLSIASFYPVTVRVEDRMYAIQIAKSSWKMPFKVHLTKFTHEFHPGTMRPKRFESEIERIEEEQTEPVLIKMNEPMRREGFTFFQASWGPQDGPPGRKLFSVFEVVKNPADKWPEYSLYIVAAGLLLQFSMKLIQFIIQQTKRNG
jgi:hypothetical protein